MFGGRYCIEPAAVERLGFAAPLTFDEGSANRFDLGLTGPVMPNQIAIGFAVVGRVPVRDLSFDPLFLVRCDRNGLTRCVRDWRPKSMENSRYRCNLAHFFPVGHEPLVFVSVAIIGDT